MELLAVGIQVAQEQARGIHLEVAEAVDRLIEGGFISTLGN
jgi:hypothetical protein